MVRFLHTADWQMGMKAVHVGERAQDLRKTRYTTAETIAEVAEAEDVDFVIVAGDLFEHHDVDELDVKRTVDELDRFDPIPVYVLPGNHDPLVPGGVWERSSWDRVGDHVTLLRDEEPVHVDDSVTLYPCPLEQKQSSRDPTDWIPPRDDEEAIRIGIAHGALDVLPAENLNFPVSADRPDQADLDYLALGDWHGYMKSGRALYPGTPEPTGFDEEDPGNVALVELSGGEAEPIVDKENVQTLRWAAFEESVEDVTDVEALGAEIEGLGDPTELVLRVDLSLAGDLSSDVVQQIQTLRDQLDDEAFLLQWEEDQTGPIAIDPDTDLPDGPIRRTDEALATILDGEIPDGPGQDFADREEETVRQARRLLHRIAQEVEP